MKKIKLNHTIEVYSTLSFDEIEKIVREHEQKLNQELSEANAQDKFEIEVSVKLPNKSIAIY